MIPTYMHRLNALQITAFPEREKKTPNKYRNSLLCSLDMFTCKLPAVERGRTQPARCCTAVRVCVRVYVRVRVCVPS